MLFFNSVDSKEVPKGMENDEGRLLWLPASQIWIPGFLNLVDDLNYIWPDTAGVWCSSQDNWRERTNYSAFTFHLIMDLPPPWRVGLLLETCMSGWFQSSSGVTGGSLRWFCWQFGNLAAYLAHLVCVQQQDATLPKLTGTSIGAVLTAFTPFDVGGKLALAR